MSDRAPISGPTKIIKRASDLDGPRSTYRWMAMSFGQDSDLLFNGDFEEGAGRHIASLDGEERATLRDEVSDVLTEVEFDAGDEAHKLDQHWYSYGAEWWSMDRPLAEGLRYVLKALDAGRKA